MNNRKHSKDKVYTNIENGVLSTMTKLAVENCFVIPSTYFDGLQHQLMNHAFVKVSNDFVVPENYFNTLPEKVCNHALINKNIPFLIPQNYFEQFPAAIEQKVGLRTKAINQEVPEGYFEQLPIKIQDRLYQKDRQTTVYRIPQFGQLRPMLVAAAIVLLCSMLYFLKMFDTSKPSKNQLAANNQSSNHINILNDELRDYDETLLIEAIDKPVQINIASNNQQEQLKERITEFLLDNQITTDDIASEI